MSNLHEAQREKHYHPSQERFIVKKTLLYSVK